MEFAGSPRDVVRFPLGTLLTPESKRSIGDIKLFMGVHRGVA